MHGVLNFLMADSNLLVSFVFSFADDAGRLSDAPISYMELSMAAPNLIVSGSRFALEPVEGTAVTLVSGSAEDVDTLLQILDFLASLDLGTPIIKLYDVSPVQREKRLCMNAPTIRIKRFSNTSSVGNGKGTMMC